MTRLPRTLLNAATIASLLLAVASAIVWLRSYVVPSSTVLSSKTITEDAPSPASFYFHSQRRVDHVFLIEHGQLGYVRNESGADADLEGAVDFDVLVAVARQFSDPNWADVHKRVDRLGFQIYTARTGVLVPGRAYQRILIPFWFLTVLFAAMPLLRARRAWDRRRWLGPNACRACGYDLRATPERCPECGAVPVKGAAA